MPGGDGTGPMGSGARTGREAGYCAGFDVPGSVNPMSGRGMGRGFGWGRGRGRGRGWRHGFYAAGWPHWAWQGPSPMYPTAPVGVDVPPEQQAAALREQAKHLENTLNEIRQRIAELDANPAEEA